MLTPGIRAANALKTASCRSLRTATVSVSCQLTLVVWVVPQLLYHNVFLPTLQPAIPPIPNTDNKTVDTTKRRMSLMRYYISMQNRFCLSVWAISKKICLFGEQWSLSACHRRMLCSRNCPMHNLAYKHSDISKIHIFLTQIIINM